MVSYYRAIRQAYQQPFSSMVVADGDGGHDISPFVKRIASGKSIPADVDHKKDYADFLGAKYQ